VDLLVSRITDNQLRAAAENVKAELQSILISETNGTGQLARSVQVQRGTQRGKPVLRILTAPHGRAFFHGTSREYAGIPPSDDIFPGSIERFNFWAIRNGFRPRRLARIIALGKSTGKVYSDRSEILIRALRRGFHL